MYYQNVSVAIDKTSLQKHYFDHDILKTLEEQKGVPPTGLHLSAAFDTVDHRILIMVLENKDGISGQEME